MNNQTYAVVALVVALLAGFFLGNNYGSSQLREVDGSKDQTVLATHAHVNKEVNADAPIPSVKIIEVNEDRIPNSSKIIEEGDSLNPEGSTFGGYNLLLQFENYTLRPQNAGQDPIDNEGHAHLYINGKEIGRIYSKHIHVPARLLEEGENTIVVNLSNNDHSEIVNGDEHISDSVAVTVEQ